MISHCGLKWRKLPEGGPSWWADRPMGAGFQIDHFKKGWVLFLVRDRGRIRREVDTSYSGFKTAQEAADAACRIHTRAARKKVYQKARKREQAQKTLFGRAK